MENVILSSIERHLKNKAFIRESLINLISFDNKDAYWDEGKAIDVIILDFTETFDAVPPSIFLDKLSSCEMSGYLLHCMKN